MQETTQTTEDFAIPLDRIAPSKNDNLNIWFKQAKYEELVRWLWFLEMEQGFYISQLNLARLPEDGWASGFLVVSAELGGAESQWGK